MPHFSSHNRMSNFQSAYRKYHSCETALLRVQNNIFVSLDASRFTALLLLDLSATFDITDHSILLNCLKNWFGVSSTALNLLASFLSGRFQVVVTSNVKSQPNLLRYRVTLCSVLGLLLYSLYSTPLFLLYPSILVFSVISMQMIHKFIYRFLLSLLHQPS